MLNVVHKWACDVILVAKLAFRKPNSGIWLFLGLFVTEKRFGFLYYSYMVLHCLFDCQIRESWRFFILVCDIEIVWRSILLLFGVTLPLWLPNSINLAFSQYGLWQRNCLAFYIYLFFVLHRLFDCQILEIWRLFSMILDEEIIWLFFFYITLPFLVPNSINLALLNLFWNRKIVWLKKPKIWHLLFCDY